MKQKKENVKVKSVRRESKFLCGEIEGRKWDTQIFWFDESFLTNFPDFKFISAGDWVQITYKEENVKKSFTFSFFCFIFFHFLFFLAASMLLSVYLGFYFG